MGYQFKLEKFEGPLDLLLQLIESADLDITEVALSEVADQFMQHLTEVEEKNPEEMADFLVIASKLLLIKSKILLPNLDLGGDEEILSLENQLKIYKEYYDASKKIEEILLSKKVLFSRKKIPLDIEVLFNPPKNLGMEKLKKVFLEIIKEIEPIVRLPKKSLCKAISIKQKIESIKNKILQGMKLNFSELIKESKDRTDVIITFLGVLELVKQKSVSVHQDDKFGDIIVSRVEAIEKAN